jgi:hypothetical protein
LEKLDLVQFANGSLVLGLSHFLKLPQLPQKMWFDLKSGQEARK